jgi:primosomal protein N'
LVKLEVFRSTVRGTHVRTLATLTGGDDEACVALETSTPEVECEAVENVELEIVALVLAPRAEEEDLMVAGIVDMERAPMRPSLRAGEVAMWREKMRSMKV